MLSFHILMEEGFSAPQLPAYWADYLLQTSTLGTGFTFNPIFAIYKSDDQYAQQQ